MYFVSCYTDVRNCYYEKYIFSFYLEPHHSQSWLLNLYFKQVLFAILSNKTGFVLFCFLIPSKMKLFFPSKWWANFSNKELHYYFLKTTALTSERLARISRAYIKCKESGCDPCLQLWVNSLDARMPSINSCRVIFPSWSLSIRRKKSITRDFLWFIQRIYFFLQTSKSKLANSFN